MACNHKLGKSTALTLAKINELSRPLGKNTLYHVFIRRPTLIILIIIRYRPVLQRCFQKSGRSVCTAELDEFRFDADCGIACACGDLSSTVLGRKPCLQP
jgi:hypothetical protein